MKSEIISVLVSISVVMLLAFSLFSFGGFTGFVVSDSFAGGISDNAESGEDIIIEVSKEYAIDAIDASRDIIDDLISLDFSVSYFEDTLLEAERVFEQIGYAEVLTGDSNASDREVSSARIALKLVNWKDIKYADVLVYTDEIAERRDRVVLLNDKLEVKRSEIEAFEASGGIFEGELFETGIPVVWEELKIAFSEERLDDADVLLIDLRNLIESEREKKTTFASFRSNAFRFFQKYWIYLIIVLALLIIIVVYSFKWIRKNILRNSIRKMKIEKRVLLDLTKKTQIDRFKLNKISGLVYNIRIEKYKDRLNVIDGELPVLEARFYGRKVKENSQV